MFYLTRIETRFKRVQTQLWDKYATSMPLTLLTAQ